MFGVSGGVCIWEGMRPVEKCIVWATPAWVGHSILAAETGLLL